MGKLWGYDYPSTLGRTCPGGRFSRHKIGPNKSRVFMKLPEAYDIQRLVLARQLMYLTQVEVYKGKQNSLDFEDKVTEFKKRPLLIRAPRCYSNGTGIHGALRRKREKPSSEIEGLSSPEEFDFNYLSFIRLERLPRFSTLPDNEPATTTSIEQSEDWQCRNWKKMVNRDINSTAVNEVIGNFRLVTLEDAAISYHQPKFTIFLESARHGLKHHDWGMVCKAVLGLIQEYPRNPWNKMPSIVWTLGFFTLINHYKYDIQLLRHFTVQAKALVKGYPAWLSVQVGLWLMQKGFFNEGFLFMDDWYSNLPQHSYYLRNKFLYDENPKRSMVFFLVELIKAKRHYCIWKRDSVLCNDDSQIAFVYEDSVKRNGETALTSYESVYKFCTLADADVMSFLEPFVELLVEFRSANRAKQIVQEVFDHSYGNMFVEQFYVEFMEKHFSDEYSTEELRILRQRFEGKFTYQSDKAAWRKSRARISRLRDNRKKKGIAVKLKPFSMPGYSW